MNLFARLCGVTLALLANGCAYWHDRPPVDRYDVRDIDLRTISSKEYLVEHNNIVGYESERKELTITVARLQRQQFEGATFRVVQLMGQPGEEGWWPPSAATCSIEYPSNGSTYYSMKTQLLGEAVRNRRIIIEINAGGQHTDIILEPLNPEWWEVYKHSPTGWYWWDGASWVRRHRPCIDLSGYERVPVVTTRIDG